MNVSDLMTADLVTVAPGDSLQDAGRAMLDWRVGSAIVVADAPTGIVTETDLIEAACERNDALDAIRVADAMSAPLETVAPDASVRSALRRMDEEGIKKLPVMDGLDLVGIVTLTDVALHLPEHLSEVRRIENRRAEWTD